ncbi:MAG: hypothetical protein HYU66_20005 [Armatimonadetes bacterium]|nr:hypothetical protein [Armatimonadota bacterium]
MFGKPSRNGAEPERASAADNARIRGGGLVQVVVTAQNPLTFSIFLNDKPVPQVAVDNLLITIEAPGDEEPNGVVEATLTQQVRKVSGENVMEALQLFPCTVEIVALGRRMSVTCREAGQLDGVWIDLGLKPDGTGLEVSGARKLEVVLTQDLLDAQLTWEDGTTEAVFPEEG